MLEPAFSRSPDELLDNRYSSRRGLVLCRAGPGLAINLERESSRAVTCEELRPDVDWA
ncbi:helix-turn-helix domain-containing protein [Pseudomonas sp. ANT_H14]|nr:MULTISPECIES: YdaS family helix-turn-helix protein [unclassified Pseudomonas]KAA0943197.1 helix-turn-helix domain-containing protein [Pseudomonas sp. ANT_H4]KAA0945891.1 helix-turn-helix domain-containing protein [Pseudomonas sp. ANT_H14]